MLFKVFTGSLLASVIFAQDAVQMKKAQLQAAMVNTNGQIETTDNGVQENTSDSLRAGPRGYNLWRTPRSERSYSTSTVNELLNVWFMLSAMEHMENATSEVFTRFSVVVASLGGSESGRDTHGFATKIYSPCGNQDLVGNHLPSFFINDGSDFPDLVHSVKFEVDKGFPTGGSAHTTAYDFFTQHPEGTFQLMNVISDLGIPRDVRHIGGAGVHTYRFINNQGQSQLFKWYWLPVLGHRSLVYDEVTTLQGKNNNFQRIDLYNNIEAGNFPEWELAVQLFPDDGTFMYKGIDLIQAPNVVPFELNPPMKLGKLTLNRNPSNFFAEPEAISFAPSNVVRGVSFVPDPLLQWRLMAYDDTSTHRHNSPNGYLLPINRPIAPVNNNYRDGYMQPQIFVGDSTSTPDGIGGVQDAGPDATLPYTSKFGQSAGVGNIGRYAASYDWFGQARLFWGSLDIYAQQHTVDGYRFELGHVADANVTQTYIDKILNNVDNCLARRVAFGVGAKMPALGSGPTTNSTNSTTSYPSWYPLAQSQEPNKSNVGLTVGVMADNNLLSTTDLSSLASVLNPEKVFYDIVAPHQGPLSSGVSANNSYITTSSVMYDAIFIGSSSNSSTVLGPTPKAFVLEAYSHGKAIAAIGTNGAKLLSSLGLTVDAELGVFAGNAETVATQIMTALSGPVRFFARFPVDDPSLCQ